MQLMGSELPDALLAFKEKLTPRFFEVRAKVIDFVQDVVNPALPTYSQQKKELLKTVPHPTQCPEPPILNELRREAKARGLLNLFLPEVSKLSVLEYSPIAEILGTNGVANLAMNCSAPDTGNMEVLEKFGTEEQKKIWLEPLLNGEIRSAFAMTEPGVASSDATNICTKIEADGDHYVINGHKWWISGAIRPECKVFVVLGRTSFSGPLHKQQSMILVPKDTEGVNIVRPLAVFGEEHDHAEIVFDNVRVPKSNMLLGEGRGFEIAQSRLGPGRIHHCMRSLGVAELALAAMVDRAHRRKAFGKLLAQKDAVRMAIAEARIEITKCRQLCYLAAVVADEQGFKAAKSYIAMIKVAAPRAALTGPKELWDNAKESSTVTQIFLWFSRYTGMRTLRVADGPDMVHLITIAKEELSKRDGFVGHYVSGTNQNVQKYGKFQHVEHGELYSGRKGVDPAQRSQGPVATTREPARGCFIGGTAAGEGSQPRERSGTSAVGTQGYADVVAYDWLHCSLAAAEHSLQQVHSANQSFYSYGPPGTPHSDFVRIVSSKLPYHVRPDKPSRTLNDWLAATSSVPEVLNLIGTYGAEFDGTNTATAMHRLAKWNREAPHHRLFEDSRWQEVLTHLDRNMQAPNFQSRHLTGALWSFATLGRRARGPHLDKVMEQVSERLQEFTCVDLALTAWSMATMKLEPPGLYDRISKCSLACIGEFQPQALANIMWATATLKKENDALIRHSAYVAVKHLDAGMDFRPHEYSTMVWSMVITQAREECLFSRVSGHVVRRVTEFGPQELTNTAWAFASLGFKTEGLFEALGKECSFKLRHFNMQNLTNVAWSYSHLRVGDDLLSEVAEVAHSRIHEMNVQDLAQLALTLVFSRRANFGLKEDLEDDGVLGSRDVTLALVLEVTKAMVRKIRQPGATTPDDAWIVHDLVLVWFEESKASELLGDAWKMLDAYMDGLYHQVLDFLRNTPLLARALACGSVVQSAHVPIYEQSFRELDIRSLGIKYTGVLLAELGLTDRGDDGLSESARRMLAEEKAELLRQDPGAGSQNWCLFRYDLSSELREAKELAGIRVRSCGGDPLALELLDPPREAHLVAVRLSNDRLNHRRRDAEFRAIAHTAGILRALIPNADQLMQDRIVWGNRLRGWVHLYVTEVPCLSCLGAMVQFARRFPRVQLRVAYPGSDLYPPRR
ncbi:ACAD11 [Symbiodinium natans]|uniref:ACAD11 protein n=1 Tax=Symbiodinium natans TaxID=878477 RepID=A0A812PCM8_9DINO|nr:ACAD11 [Symbiodinium natans]